LGESYSGIRALADFIRDVTKYQLLPSRMVIHEELELIQIPILWRMEFKEMEGDELTLGKGMWSFI